MLEGVAIKCILAACDAAVDEAVKKERIREEWRRREHWVQRQALERRGPKKGKHKVRVTPAKEVPSKEELHRSVQGAFDLVKERAQLY